MRNVKTLTAVLITLASFCAPMQSRADSPAPQVASPPGAFLTSNTGSGNVVVSAGYAPAVVVVTQSGGLTYTNLDIKTHNFISDATTTDPAKWDPRYCNDLKPLGWQPGDPLPPCALFQDWSTSTDGLGSRDVTQSAPVLLQMPNGTPKLQVNTPYKFYCSYHTNMVGTLIAIAG
jgi:plastocyanin